MALPQQAQSKPSGSTQGKKPFVHLHVHSHFSLLDGLAKVDELVARAKELGQPAIALTDHGALYGVVPFYQAAKKAGIKPIIGVEAYIAARGLHDKDAGVDSKRYHLTLLARTNEGYKNLVRMVTKANLEGFYYKPRMDKDLLRKHSEGLIALSGCISGEIGKAILSGNRKKAEKLIAEYQDIFGKENFYLELCANPNLEEQQTVNTALIELSQTLNVPLVATNDTHYLKSEDVEAHEVLLAIQTGKNVDDPNRLSLKSDDFSLCDVSRIEEIFPNMPQVIDNTVRIAERCNVELPLGENRLPSYPLPKGTTPEAELRRLGEEGLIKRFGEDGINKEIRDRFEYELTVIEKTGFAGYFLIVQDVVNWAKAQGIVVGPGRGSAAGSLVSYVLNITNVDPIQYGLLFERFLNPERISMPDIDLDFADYRRDEVLRYVTEKYGADKVAQIGTFGTMAARAVIRDAGRALGLPYGLCDRVAKMIPFGMTLAEALENSEEFNAAYSTEPEVHDLVEMGKKLEGVARHVSTHACGVVIADEPLDTLVPVQYTTSSSGDRHTITQFEMHAIEDVGLLKMDFLGLRNLSIIEDTIGRVQDSLGITVDIDTIPLDDKKTFDLLARGDTTGVFQLESGGMRRYLRDLEPTELEDIIAMVALYRPGPMELLPSYIRRKHGKEPVTFIHPSLEPILGKTYGVGIYQEQMMQIATDLAGYTLPEADTLRKAIGKKIHELLAEQQEKLISGMVANDIPEKTAKKIWELFPPFADYGFNRSHAACYALIAYQTAYLKANYPYEFMSALFTHEGSNIERTATLISESRAHNIPVLPPDVNASLAGFAVVYEDGEPKGIRFGLASIKNVGTNVVDRIVEERLKSGSYRSLEDFLNRIAGPEVNKKSLEALIKVGALDALGERLRLFKGIDMIAAFIREKNQADRLQQSSLFGESAKVAAMHLPDVPEATRDEKLMWEKELLGLWVSAHPLEDYAVALEESATAIADLRDLTEDKTLTIGGIITSVKKITTKSGLPMLFVNVEDLSSNTEVIVFPRVYKEIGNIFQENAVLLFNGTAKTRSGETKLLVNQVKRLIAT